jgi:hypothetical protein
VLELGKLKTTKGIKKMQIEKLLTKDDLTMLVKSETTTRQLATFSDEDKDVISYFFMRLQNVYGSLKIKTQWPDVEDLKMARREFGRVIARFSRENINEAFDLVHKERRSGNDKFDWPNIDAIIGLLTNEGVFTGSAGTLSHKMYQPEQLLESGTKKERDATARSHLDTMLNMF